MRSRIEFGWIVSFVLLCFATVHWRSERAVSEEIQSPMPDPFKSAKGETATLTRTNRFVVRGRIVSLSAKQLTIKNGTKDLMVPARDVRSLELPGSVFTYNAETKNLEVTQEKVLGFGGSIVRKPAERNARGNASGNKTVPSPPLGSGNIADWQPQDFFANYRFPNREDIGDWGKRITQVAPDSDEIGTLIEGKFALIVEHGSKRFVSIEFLRAPTRTLDFIGLASTQRKLTPQENEFLKNGIDYCSMRRVHGLGATEQSAAGRSANLSGNEYQLAVLITNGSDRIPIQVLRLVQDKLQYLRGDDKVLDDFANSPMREMPLTNVKQILLPLPCAASSLPSVETLVFDQESQKFVHYLVSLWTHKSSSKPIRVELSNVVYPARNHEVDWGLEEISPDGSLICELSPDEPDQNWLAKSSFPKREGQWNPFGSADPTPAQLAGIEKVIPEFLKKHPSMSRLVPGDILRIAARWDNEKLRQWLCPGYVASFELVDGSRFTFSEELRAYIHEPKSPLPLTFASLKRIPEERRRIYGDIVSLYLAPRAVPEVKWTQLTADEKVEFVNRTGTSDWAKCHLNQPFETQVVRLLQSAPVSKLRANDALYVAITNKYFTLPSGKRPTWDDLSPQEQLFLHRGFIAAERNEELSNKRFLRNTAISAVVAYGLFKGASMLKGGGVSRYRLSSCSGCGGNGKTLLGSKCSRCGGSGLHDELEFEP